MMSIRCLIASGLLGGVGLVAPLNAFGVHAAYAICRTDPTISLSNGAKITLYDDVSDSASDITRVVYQLHGPTGTKVTSVVYDQYQAKESFSYVADLGGNTYRTLTTVYTGKSNVSVTVHASVSGITCNGVTSQAQTGVSGQLIAFPFNC